MASAEACPTIMLYKRKPAGRLLSRPALIYIQLIYILIQDVVGTISGGI